MIDLLNLEPTKISRDLKGKFMLIYSQPKAGKTSLATCFKNSLLVAFEKGYNGLPNIMAIDCTSWATMKEILRELKKPEVQQKYDSIIIDTATIASEKCEEFVCQQNKVSEISAIPWGRGYKLYQKEFSRLFREITMLGYGLVFLAHNDERVISDTETLQAPQLEKRAYRIINGLVDIIAYIDVDYKTGQRYLQLRQTPTVVAGCRFKYMPDRIELSYDNLVNNLVDAIEKQGDESGVMPVDERLDFAEEVRPFEEVMFDAKNLWEEILSIDDSEQTYARIDNIIENNFGQVVKLSTITERQQDILELVNYDLKDLLKSLKNNK